MLILTETLLHPNNSGLQITSAGPINVTNNQKISGVDLQMTQDVATKAYVDSAIQNLETLSLALDIQD